MVGLLVSEPGLKLKLPFPEFKAEIDTSINWQKPSVSLIHWKLESEE